MNTRLVLLEDSAEGSLSRLLQTLGVHFELQASLEDAVCGDNINSNKKSVLIRYWARVEAASLGSCRQNQCERENSR